MEERHTDGGKVIVLLERRKYAAKVVASIGVIRIAVVAVLVIGSTRDIIRTIGLVDAIAAASRDAGTVTCVVFRVVAVVALLVAFLYSVTTVGFTP